MARVNYSKEFKQTLVELIKNGKKPSELGLEYNIAQQTIRRWYREAGSEQVSLKSDSDLQMEHQIKQLKKRLKDAELERDILKKAVSIFSKSDK